MPKKNRRKPSPWPQILIISGLLLLVVVILALKDRSRPEASASTIALPQAQLEQALSAGKPALAFFHSNNCEQCIIMIETVDQVYPEFAMSIELVDVNVYDPKNEPLIQKVKLQYIPTLVFFDRTGKSLTHVGVLQADTLRRQLKAMAGEQ